jgi:hypothetical protein
LRQSIKCIPTCALQEGPESAQISADWAGGAQHSILAMMFFSASDRLVPPLSFSFGLDRCHAQIGGA